MNVIDEIIVDICTGDDSDYRITPPQNGSIGPRASNRERTGYRDMTVSAILRSVGTGADSKSDNIRHVDSDFRQTCAKCGQKVVSIEDSADPNKMITFTCVDAYQAKNTVFAVKAIHEPNNPEANLREVAIIENGVNEVYREFDVSVGIFQLLMENLSVWHEQNECPGFIPKNIVRR